MKKFTKSIIAGTLALACCGVFALAGCGGSDDTKTYTITFDYNYTGSTSTTQTVEEGSTVSRPSDPTRDGYTFDDWYTTSACTSGSEVDFTAEIYADATYYAGWTEAAAAVTEYTVTFVISSGSSITQTVASGETATVPEDPEYGNYVFTGWYSDEECTTSYDFSTEITADATVYAGWIVVEEGYVAVSYMWNYEGAGVYKVITIESGEKITSRQSASRDGYLLQGWYTDEDCTTEFVIGTKVTENLTLYACWYKEYTFEAEYTNLYDENDEPRNFYGYSLNVQGEKAVWEDATGTASNGYFIACMYAKGAYLYFEIESDAAISDAVLYMRLAFEYGYSTSTATCFDGDSVGTVTVTSDQYKVLVNDTQVTYSTLSFDVSSLTGGDYISFTDYYINNISLNEGTNVIRLEVNNDLKGEGGTQRAKAPLVDCIKIYSGTTLTWNPITSNIG